MARRPRPLRAVSLVFGSFVTLAFLSQLSAHFLAEAIPKHLVPKNEAALQNILHTSTQLAVAAGAIGLVFAGAVLIITRQAVASDIDIYRATGLSPSSAYIRLLRSHSTRPLEWVALATAAVSLADLYFGLDALLPIGLAASFAILLVVWLAFLTSASFSHERVESRTRGRAG